MIRKTLRNRIYLVFMNITVIYLFSLLFIVGLTPVSGGNNRGFTTTRRMSLYCLTCGCCALVFYIWQVVLVTTHPNSMIFYSGAGRVTLTAMIICAAVLIFTFYSVAFLNRFKLCKLFNHSTAIYRSFDLFYSGNFGKMPLSYDSVDSEDELSFVYLRLFNKVFLVNLLIVSSILGISFRAQALADFNPLNCACFFLIPYMVKSLTSSFLYLGALRPSFLFHKMNLKLLEIRKELQETTKTNKTHFERMSKFCEISDLIDNLSLCYQLIIDFGQVIQELFRVQIVLVLTYSVISTLHEMFSMYQMMSGSAIQNTPLDQRLVIYNIAYIILNIAEIMLVVNISEIMFMGSLRVGKNVQSLMYVKEMDERLRQSVRKS